MKKLALLGGSFNPFTKKHFEMVANLLKKFDEIIVLPCGIRPDKLTTNDINPVHRAAMIDMSLQGLPTDRVHVDYSDLEKDQFTPTHVLEERYSDRGEVWHVIGGDLISGGMNKKSAIQRWREAERVWNTFNFVIFPRNGYDFDTRDLPPRHMVRALKDEGLQISSSLIRTRAYSRESITDLVMPGVESYIKRHNLYLGLIPNLATDLVLDDPRILPVVDRYNPQAISALDQIKSVIDRMNPNLIVVMGGDGTLLRAARKLWRRRLPILGINFGHIGHNLNDVRDKLEPKLFTQPLKVWFLPLLFVETTSPEGKCQNEFAFNDAWVAADITKGATAWMQVQIDGQVKMPRVVGDGLLVTTPQGSTGYARSMGAVPLRSDSRELLLVGNNLYSPAWKQARLNHSSEIVISNADGSHYRKLYGCVDGKYMGEVQEMKIRTSRFAAVELAFFPDYDPIRKLDAIQFP
jgi:NAD+ kinase